jgi:hypothetical protein
MRLKNWNSGWWLPIGILAVGSQAASAKVHIAALQPSLASPQAIGAVIDWTASATDTNRGPLAFQFNVAAPNGVLTTARNFVPGTLGSGGAAWQAQPFVWALTGMDGTYQVQVIAKDFTSGETGSLTVSFTVTSPVTGTTPVVIPTANPLVAIFNAPSCAAGSAMRVFFQAQTGGAPSTTTNWVACHPPATMTFEIAGVYPGTPYTLYAQVETGGKGVNGPAVSFTAGQIPSAVPRPAFQIGVQAGADDPNRTILHGFFDVGQGLNFPNVATDLAGNIIWYNYPNDTSHLSMLTRPLAGGYVAIQAGTAWNPGVEQFQVLRQLDWAGNIVRETNTGIVQQQLMALGDPDARGCNTIASPPPVGAACLGIFHHDAIETLPNGYTAALMDVERIFPPGTQGDTSGLPVDVIGDLIVVLDQNWNAVWYWDAFNPAGGGNGYAEMPVSRPAVLGETCSANGKSECLALFLLGSGVAPQAHDWLHCNTLYYWPHDGTSGNLPGDILLSSRHQDWVIKIDYQDGSGTGNIDWRMGPSGDFTFLNTFNDPWPWFSHQHDAGIENNGTGVFDAFDNGNTRRAPPSGPGSSTGGVPGLGSNCGPNDCNSRGMALTIDETKLQAVPVLSDNLGVFADAMGSAQLLADGNYFFLPAIVVTSGGNFSYSIEVEPIPGTGSATQVMNLAGSTSYRAFQMPNLYSPPTT